MDYEKKYNEALERARKAYNAIPPESRGARKIIEDAFPELRESEDERMRKLLIERVRSATEMTEGLRELLLTYLEKQKEQKPVEKIGFHKCKTGEVVTEWKKEDIDDKMLSKSKPSWSEEDEKIMQTMIKEGDLKPSEIAWLKSIRPQPRQEWSEEDEEMWMDIKCQMIHGSFIPFDKIEWLENRIKSLRPSWRPSKDEERLINTSIVFLKDFADKGYENAVECIDWLKSKLKNGDTYK